MIRSVETVQADLFRIETKLNGACKKIRSIRRRQHRERKVPIPLRRVVKVIFALSHPQEQPAIVFLNQNFSHHVEEKKVKRWLRNWYAQCVQNYAVDSLLNPTTKIGRSALARAKRFLQEFELHEWVETTNASKAIAPMTGVLLRRASSSAGPGESPPLLRMDTKFKHQLQWLKRWRRRWQVGLGSLVARDTLSPASCRQKAHGKNIPSARPKTPCMCTQWASRGQPTPKK